VTAADSIEASARLLIKKRNYKKAFRSLCDLNRTSLQAARELYHIHAQIEAENWLHFGSPTYQESTQRSPRPRRRVHGLASIVKKCILLGNTGFWSRVRQLGSVARIRRALVAAFVVMMSQQLCGVNVIGA
jgi:hypothetical protein